MLENSCFACSDNEAHLVGVEVTQGVPPLVARIGMAQWLVQQVQTLGRQGLVLGLKKVSLRGRGLLLHSFVQYLKQVCVHLAGLPACATVCLDEYDTGQSCRV